MTLPELKVKHNKLKKLDGSGLFGNGIFKVFGSETHKYRFNPYLQITELDSFEKSFSISLPSEYRVFLSEVGNGGSGPGYGLLPLSCWDYELEIDDNGFLANEFPHIAKWNIPTDFDTDSEDYTETEEFQNWEQDYYSNSHVTGSIRICHYGCAIYGLLVVTGREAGHIWIDDRASENGIYPANTKMAERLTFFDWYGSWLDESLNQIA